MSKDIKQLNEKLAIIQDNQNMNEMANIEKYIIVHNDKEPGQSLDNDKFAYFHYNDIHFKFKQECPKNLTELKTMIAFDSEKNQISDRELSELLKILQRKPSGKKLREKALEDEFMKVFDLINNDCIYIEPKLIPIIPGDDPAVINRAEYCDDN